MTKRALSAASVVAVPLLDAGVAGAMTTCPPAWLAPLSMRATYAAGDLPVSLRDVGVARTMASRSSSRLKRAMLAFDAFSGSG